MPTLTLKFDGTLEPLLEYLRHIDDCYGRAANKERLLLKVGRLFFSQELTGDERAVVEQAARLADKFAADAGLAFARSAQHVSRTECH